jgi:hypothetical protein
MSWQRSLLAYRLTQERRGSSDCSEQSFSNLCDLAELRRCEYPPRHSKPACGCVSEIVKAEVYYSKIITSFLEGMMHIVAVQVEH